MFEHKEKEIRMPHETVSKLNEDNPSAKKSEEHFNILQIWLQKYAASTQDTNTGGTNKLTSQFMSVV